MSTRGSLVRRFPAHAITLPLTVFDDPKFQHELAFRLSQFDSEVVQDKTPLGKSFRKPIVDFADTRHPGLMTEMLMATLAPLGSAVTAQQIVKRVGEDVLWNIRKRPWKRSPFWLMLRITIQSTLSVLLPAEQASVQYKNFLLLMLIELASESKRLDLAPDICQMIFTKIARRSSTLGQDIRFRT